LRRTVDIRERYVRSARRVRYFTILHEPCSDDIAADPEELGGLHLVFFAMVIRRSNQDFLDVLEEVRHVLLEEVGERRLQGGGLGGRNVRLCFAGKRRQSKVRSIDLVAMANQKRMVDDVLEFPDVAWP